MTSLAQYTVHPVPTIPTQEIRKDNLTVGYLYAPEKTDV